YRECQPAIIPVAKDRRLQNINCFVIEPFKNRAREVLVRIDNQRNCAPVWLTILERRGPRWWRRPKYQAGKIGVDNESRPERRDERSQINMPPICAQGKALEPFRAVNNAVRPFIGDFRLQQGIPSKPFLDLSLGQS